MAMTRADPERRRHRRFELTCPIVVTDAQGNELLRTRTVNISDGGALVEPHEQAVHVGQTVGVDLHLPRSTANTFMYEQVSSEARVVRHHPLADAEAPALTFIEPLKLDLES